MSKLVLVSVAFILIVSHGSAYILGVEHASQTPFLPQIEAACPNKSSSQLAFELQQCTATYAFCSMELQKYKGMLKQI